MRRGCVALPLFARGQPAVVGVDSTPAEDWAAAAADAAASLSALERLQALAAARDSSALALFAAAAKALLGNEAESVWRGEAATLSRLEHRLAQATADALADAAERKLRAERLAASVAASHSALLQREEAARRRVEPAERSAAVAELRAVLATSHVGDTVREQELCAERDAALREVASLRRQLAAHQAADAEVARVTGAPAPQSPSAAAAEAGKPHRARKTREPAGDVVHEPSSAAEDSLQRAALAASAPAATRCAADEAAFQAFGAAPPRPLFCSGVPFPDVEALRQAIRSGAIDSGRLRALRLRWHPDNFMRRYGAFAATSEEWAAIERAVTGVASSLSAL